MVKPNAGARRAVGRRLVRPRLERPEEAQVDGGTTGVEVSTLMEDEKAGSSHEPEPSGDSLVHQASSSRKRLASETEQKEDDAAARDEVGSNALPPLKKSKDSDVVQGLIQDDNEEQTNLPSAENIETAEPALPASSISDLQAPFEDMETDALPVLLNEEIVEVAEEEDTFIKEEQMDPQKLSLDESSREDEVQGEGDAVIEESSDRSKQTTELLDEGMKCEGAKEMLQEPDADDDKEEGEIPDEPPEEQQGGKLRESQHESTPSDIAGVGDETGYAMEAASPEIPCEKSGGVDGTDDAQEGLNGEDQPAPDSSQSPVLLLQRIHQIPQWLRQFHSSRVLVLLLQRLKYQK